MAAESSSAVVLDWYSRLERTSDEYTSCHAGRRVRGRNAEQVVAADPVLGGAVGAEMTRLRELRNQVAHDGLVLRPPDAVNFAERCLTIIGVLGIAIDKDAA